MKSYIHNILSIFIFIFIKNLSNPNSNIKKGKQILIYVLPCTRMNPFITYKL